MSVILKAQNLTIKNDQDAILCQFESGGTTITVKDIEHLTVLGPSGNPVPCPYFTQ
jgi:hypothetical protein